MSARQSIRSAFPSWRTPDRLIGALLAALVMMAMPARGADILVADFSEHIIKIDQSFAGRRIHAFGLVSPEQPRSQDGFVLAPPSPIDVVIRLTGPGSPVTVRRKEPIAGVWVNTRAATFTDVPGFQAILSNRPLAEIAAADVLERNALTEASAGALASGADEDTVGPFRDALVRLKRQEGLFVTLPGAITLRGGRLFHAAIDLPAQVPVGPYYALVLAFRDGEIVAAQTIPLVVQKAGLETYIYNFAHDFPLLYGIFAVLAAFGVGFAAASVFRRS